MLKLLDLLIRDLLVGELVALTDDAQVRFQPPDTTLRTDVANLNQVALDVYLTELRENRKLRSNERLRSVDDGFVYVEATPLRLDCHYLMTAWSPVQAGPGVEPTLDEHALLYEAVTALVLRAPLNPSRVYANAPAKLALWPAEFQHDDFPTAIVPAETFAKLSEFWTTMGQDMRLKPAVSLVVTLPVAFMHELAGALVTTRMSAYLASGAPPSSAEVWIQIGGAVVHPIGGVDTPVSSAWVQIETLAGTTLQRVTTDEQGRFTVDRLRPGSYRLRAGAVGLGTQLRVVDVPAESGEYDLRFP